MRVCKHGCDVLDNYFIKAIEHFFDVYIASSKHSEGWENSRKLCITFSNSPNPPRVQMRVCRHGKMLYCLILYVIVLRCHLQLSKRVNANSNFWLSIEGMNHAYGI